MYAFNIKSSSATTGTPSVTEREGERRREERRERNRQTDRERETERMRKKISKNVACHCMDLTSEQSIRDGEVGHAELGQVCHGMSKRAEFPVHHGQHTGLTEKSSLQDIFRNKDHIVYLRWMEDEVVHSKVTMYNG